MSCIHPTHPPVDNNVSTCGGQLGILIAGITSIVSAGSYTTLAGLLTTNFVKQLGWSVSSISPGIALNMILYGLTAPFAIYAMRRFGIAKVANIALLMLVTGSGMALVPNPLMFNFAWGIIIGIGTGCLTMAYGSLIVSIWFPRQQGAISGCLVASSVFGQFALLPFWSEVMSIFGWRAPLIGSAGIAALAILANVFLLRGHAEAPNARYCGPIGPALFSGLSGAAKTWIFWVLAALFMICGATTNGIMWSHFTLAASICGLTVTAASSVLLLVGVFNVLGTTISGWLTDRVSVQIILAVAFAVRALTLLSLPFVLTGDFGAEIITFAIVFGIMDVATVPPVIAICNRVYNDDGPAVFGWVNAFHQIGAGAMAYYGSILWLEHGSYNPLWYASGVLCLIATGIVFASKYKARNVIATS
ncbi:MULTISPECIES: MFS transporter [Rhizobium]|uniref:MFS transporter n=1 Tax=Rhizobium TaxID=379 RepID=UPI001A998592|nr:MULTISPECIES: MFS transporter [Rhizobium]MBX4935280.1 MFS transporter [Rhizobium bangladeshense]MBX5242661.1 MFS transporter [Rhizobium sp. NLR22b]QSY91965.1 MFS transporter [Rhizobium bangladeshense]